MCQFVLIQYRCEHTELTAGPICQAMFIELTHVNIDPNSWTIDVRQRPPFDLPDACSPTGQNTTRVVSSRWCGWECENTYYADLAAAAAEGRLVAQQLEDLNIAIQGGEILQVLHGAFYPPEAQPNILAEDQVHQQATRATQFQGQAQAAHPTTVQNQAFRPAQSQAQTQTQTQSQFQTLESQAPQTQVKSEPGKDHLQEMIDRHNGLGTYRPLPPTQIRATCPPPWLSIPAGTAPAPATSTTGANQNIGGGSSNASTYGGSYGSEATGASASAGIGGGGRSAYTGAGNGLLDAVRNRDLARARERSRNRGTRGAGTGGVSLGVGGDRSGGAPINASPYYDDDDTPRQPRHAFSNSNANANRYSQPQSYANVDPNHGLLRLTHPVSQTQTQTQQPRGAPLAGRANTPQGGIREALGLTVPQQGFSSRHVHWQLTPRAGEEEDDDDEYEDCSSSDDDGDVDDDHVTVTMSAENMADGDVFN